MSMVIAAGRNRGYPCIPQLEDIYAIALKPPYGSRIPILKGDYPVFAGIPIPYRGTEPLPPYPDFMMHCLGSSFNDGYPCLLPMEHISRGSESQIYFGDKKAKLLFFGGRIADAAYCNGKKVFSRLYKQDIQSV